MEDVDSLFNLERKIEEIRCKLNTSALIKNLTCDETVRMSQELDYYIAAYYKKIR